MSIESSPETNSGINQSPRGIERGFSLNEPPRRMSRRSLMGRRRMSLADVVGRRIRIMDPIRIV